MTDDHSKSIHDDIAYMRGLADEGRHAPLLSGPVMVAAGVIFGLASLGQWAIVTEVLVVDPMAQLWLWLAAGGAFAVALTLLIRRQQAKPGFYSPGNKAVGAAWTAVGFGIFAMWVAFMAVGFSSGDWTLMRAMPIVVFAAYGSAWMVAGEMSDAGWMKGVALLAYGGAVLLGVFADSTWGYLVFAGLMVFVALLPGLALMRQEPSDVV